MVVEPQPMVVYGTPAQAYPTITMGPAYNPACCDINWWLVALAAIVGGVVGYVAVGNRKV